MQFFLIFLLLSCYNGLQIKNIPFPLANYLKENINLKNNLLLNDVSWEKTNNLKLISYKYFNTNNIKNSENKYGVIFKIYGCPAALFIVNYKNNQKYIEEIIFNKNLILIFDAGNLMRESYKKNINLKIYDKMIFNII